MKENRIRDLEAGKNASCKTTFIGCTQIGVESLIFLMKKYFNLKIISKEFWTA